jgi:hypothetical protein
MTWRDKKLAEACRTYFETLNRAALRQAVVGNKSELADAARDVLKNGRHDGECLYDLPDDGCSIHVATSRARRAHLLALTEKALGMKAEVA